jgi:hypothetical protein
LPAAIAVGALSGIVGAVSGGYDEGYGYGGYPAYGAYPAPYPAYGAYPVQAGYPCYGAGPYAPAAVSYAPAYPAYYGRRIYAPRRVVRSVRSVRAVGRMGYGPRGGHVMHAGYRVHR